MASTQRYDFGSYLAALQYLGMEPQVSRPLTRRAILRAHRDRVKRHHPDQFRSAAQQQRGTVALQYINGARDYVLLHFDRFAWPSQTWTREMCIAACAQYAHCWPVDPRD